MPSNLWKIAVKAINDDSAGMQHLALHFFIVLFFYSASSSSSDQVLQHLKTTGIPKLPFTILETLNHNPNTFTQGLLINKQDIFFESSGLYKKSYLVKYDITGQSYQQLSLPANIFAEGLALWDNQLIMLTWKKQIAFSINPETLEIINTTPYKGQGWGLTHNNEHWIHSNGSNTLTLRTQETFEKVTTVTVQDKSGFQYSNLNELEFAQGAIWANVWQSSAILKINMQGEVVGYFDFQELTKKHNHTPSHSVLNGIAYHPATKSFFITGKYWDKMYRIRPTYAN